MTKKLPKGWTEGTVQEFLDLTDEEMAEIEERLKKKKKVIRCGICWEIIPEGSPIFKDLCFPCAKGQYDDGL